MSVQGTTIINPGDNYHFPRNKCSFGYVLNTNGTESGQCVIYPMVCFLNCIYNLFLHFSMRMFAVVLVFFVSFLIPLGILHTVRIQFHLYLKHNRMNTCFLENGNCLLDLLLSYPEHSFFHLFI